MEPIQSSDMGLDEESADGNINVNSEGLFHLDHNPSNTIYSVDADTDKEASDSLSPGSKTVQKILSLIKKAKKPLIIAGRGCNDCPDELRQFAELLQIPVVTTLHGLGCFDERADLALDIMGRRRS